MKRKERAGYGEPIRGAREGGQNYGHVGVEMGNLVHAIAAEALVVAG
jgi:hypothetical protein